MTWTSVELDFVYFASYGVVEVRGIEKAQMQQHHHCPLFYPVCHLCPLLYASTWTPLANLCHAIVTIANPHKPWGGRCSPEGWPTTHLEIPYVWDEVGNPLITH